MFKTLQNLFKQFTNETASIGTANTREFELSMAALLCEVASADNVISEKEKNAKSHQLAVLLDINIERSNELLTLAQGNSA